MQVEVSRKNKLIAILNIAAFLVVIITNWLAVSLPLNGKNTGQLSDQYPNKFTPAGFTFSIWGVIYLFLAGFAIYQAIALFRRQLVEKKIKLISPLFVVNCLANAAWLFAWHYEQVALSVVIMLVMLVTLILIHNRLQLALPLQPFSQKLWLDIPFSLYLGWISVAAIANITALLVSFSIEPFDIPATMWTVIMVSIATALAMFMIWRKRNYVFALVVCWALYGIIAKRQELASMGSREIILVSEICIGVILLLIVVKLFSNRRLRAR
jgi:hypothetical protein